MDPAKPSKPTFLKHAAIYGLGGIVLQLASVILLPLYTRYLTPEEFGLLELINRTSQIILICFMVNGIRMATLTFYQQASSADERNRVAVTQSAFVVAILLLVSACTLVAAGPFSALVGISDPKLFAFGLIAACLEATLTVPLALMQARIESAFFAIVNVLVLVVRVALVLVALVLLDLGVWGVLAATAATSIVFGGILTIREFANRSWAMNVRQIPEVLRFVIPFLPAGVLGFLLHSSDRFILNHYAGAAEVGIYALASKLVSVVAMLSVTPLYRVWSSLMYDVAKTPNGGEVFGSIYSRLMMAYVVAGTCLCLFAPEALRLLGATSYPGVVDLLPALVLGQYFFNGACVLDSAFYVQRTTSIKPMILGIVCLFALPSLLVFIPKFGAVGAAYTLLGGYAIYWLLTVSFAQRVYRANIDWWRSSAILATAIGLVALVARFLQHEGAFFPKVAALFGWVTLLWITGLVPESDKAALAAQVARWRPGRAI